MALYHAREPAILKEEAFCRKAYVQLQDRQVYCVAHDDRLSDCLVAIGTDGVTDLMA